MQKRYLGVPLKEMEALAIAARYLADGDLPETTVVLCRRNAGKKFGLHLLAENLEDDHGNIAEFILIKSRQQSSI